MAVIEINWKPSRRELNWFAALLPVFFALLGSVNVFGYGHSAQPWVIAFCVATVVSIVGLVSHTFLRYVYLGWMLAIYPLGFVVSHLILLAVYYLVFTPVALIMKLVGYDPMRRRLDRNAPTYWLRREPTKDSKRYFRQY